jgi:hypothetical protein
VQAGCRGNPPVAQRVVSPHEQQFVPERDNLISHEARQVVARN